MAKFPMDGSCKILHGKSESCDVVVTTQRRQNFRDCETFIILYQLGLVVVVIGLVALDRQSAGLVVIAGHFPDDGQEPFPTDIPDGHNSPEDIHRRTFIEGHNSPTAILDPPSSSTKHTMGNHLSSTESKSQPEWRRPQRSRNRSGAASAPARSLPRPSRPPSLPEAHDGDTSVASSASRNGQAALDAMAAWRAERFAQQENGAHDGDARVGTSVASSTSRNGQATLDAMAEWRAERFALPPSASSCEDAETLNLRPPPLARNPEIPPNTAGGIDTTRPSPIPAMGFVKDILAQLDLHIKTAEFKLKQAVLMASLLDELPPDTRPGLVVHTADHVADARIDHLHQMWQEGTQENILLGISKNAWKILTQVSLRFSSYHPVVCCVYNLPSLLSCL